MQVGGRCIGQSQGKCSTLPLPVLNSLAGGAQMIPQYQSSRVLGGHGCVWNIGALLHVKEVIGLAQLMHFDNSNIFGYPMLGDVPLQGGSCIAIVLL